MISFPPHVFACSDLLCWDTSMVDQGLSLLPASAAAGVLRYQRHPDRCRSLAGRLLLRYGLRALGFSADLSGWQNASPNGRPYLPEKPFFSISHTGSLALCGICDTVIGVDAESECSLALEDFRRVFTREEMQAIKEAEAPGELFFILWTRKEAVLKAMGTGFLHPPELVSVLTSPLQVNDCLFYLHPLPAALPCIGHAAVSAPRPVVCRHVPGRALFSPF